MISNARRWIPLAAASGTLLLAFPAFADVTSDLLPNGNGTYQQWSGAGTHYTRVDETPCNGTTDYVSTTTVGQRESYTTDLSSVPDGSLITSIAITPCASRNNNGGGSSGLKVFYRYNGVDSADSSAYTLTGTTPTTLSASTFSGLSLTKNGSSALQIGAVYSSGTKGARLSRIATVVTYTTLPIAPSGLTATVTGSGLAIKIDWTDNASNETGFKIERGTDGINFSEITTVGANVVTYTNNSLSSCTTYYYRVRANNAAGNSAYSNTANATTMCPPAAPSSLGATSSTSVAGKISLTWTDNATNETGFKVERGTDGVNFTEVLTPGANATSVDNTGLANCTLYYYRIRATNAAGNSSYSNTASATTLCAPAAPTSLSASAAASGTGYVVNLAWTDNASNETGFRIERGTNGISFGLIATVGVDATTYQDPYVTVTTGTGAYYYRVRAYNGAGNSGYSNTASTTVP